MKRRPWHGFVLIALIALALSLIAGPLSHAVLASSGGYGYYTADDSAGLLGGYGYFSESDDGLLYGYSYGDPEYGSADPGAGQDQKSASRGGKKQDSGRDALAVREDGYYTSKDEVALYLHKYGHLPGNYVTKRQAEKAGFGSVYRTVDEACPGKSIGGSRFGNYEGLLPEGNYRECDIDYHGGRRGAKRIVWSDDGAIYYTKDHYESFERLY